jgi:hypothetical protein
VDAGTFDLRSALLVGRSDAGFLQGPLPSSTHCVLSCASTVPAFIWFNNQNSIGTSLFPNNPRDISTPEKRDHSTISLEPHQRFLLLRFNIEGAADCQPHDSRAL